MANYKWFSSKGKKAAGKAKKANQRETSKPSEKALPASYVDKSKKTRKRGTAAKTVSIIIIILVIGIVALTLSLGYYVKNLDKVYPNVWADGIKLSDMTFEEAKQALVGMGYERNAADVSATIVFPDDSSFSISGEEAGFSLNAEEAALAAYEFGRDGSFFDQEVAFIKAYLTKTELRDVSVAKFNEDFVREVVQVHTKLYNDTLINDAVEINRNNITIVKGITFAPAIEQDVFDLTVETLIQAMADKANLSAVYDPKQTNVKEIDLNDLYDTIYVEPISAQYDPETYSATESSSGVSFDMLAALAMLERAGMGDRIVIPLRTIEPEVVTDDIESLLFRDILAESTTYIGGNSNRINNVRLSASLIDGTILNPGDIFSFNETVGPRTAARGFLEAGAYVGDLVVTEIGGGICQTSSTMYVTVLKTDLEVIERRPHGMTVGYLPLGSDATVNWGSIDFKFRNNTEYPLRIEITTDDARNITVQLIGTKLDENYIKIEYNLISRTDIQLIEREDESIPQGQTKVYTEGSTGYVVDTYKYLYDKDDNLISTTLIGRSTYYVQNRVILIPPPSEEDPDELLEDDPDALPEDPDALPEDPDALPEDPDALPEDPDALPEDPNALPEDPDALPEDPDALPENPDAPPEDPDAPPEDPDAPPENPDAPPEDPDAPSENPDALPADSLPTEQLTGIIVGNF